MNENYKDFFPSKEMMEFPSIINLEVFRGKCPCRCIHCPVGRMDVNERKEFYGVEGISQDLYTKIIDEVALHSQSALRIHSVGEPLLWEELRNFVIYANSKNVQLWLFTSLLTDDTDLLRCLCENVRIIEVSVNNINEEEYRREKGVNGFEIVKKNIHFMNKYIKDNNLNCRLLVSRVQTKSLEKDNQFIKYWTDSNVAADVFVRTYHSYNDLIEKRFDIGKKNRGCLVHWLRFNISLKGKVVVCFNELFKKSISDEIVLGDINFQTISEIWKSEYLNKIRTCDLNATYLENGFSRDFPCVKCISCNSIKDTSNTSEKQLNLV